jgi:intracellular multiplication protein IcmJ
VPEPVKAAVWQRDDHTCRHCGFRALRYQEVLVGGGNARDPDQMGTVCLFCHQCLHLEEAAATRSGVLVWLPEIAQADLHWMARELYLAILTRPAGERARRLLDAVMARRQPARERLGTDDPAELARRLGAGQPEPGEAVLAGVRLWPLDRRILEVDGLEFNQFPQVLAYWRSPAGPYAAGGGAARSHPWLARLEAVLLPDLPPAAGEAEDAGTSSPGESPTHANFGAKLLGDAATFFRNVGDQNPALAAQMGSNADVFERVAALLRADPLGAIQLPGDASADAPLQGSQTVASIAARLLEDAATFFESVGGENPPLAEQMHDNAGVFRAMAARLREDPAGAIDAD